MRRRLCKLNLHVLIGALLAGPVLAQSTASQITGTVTNATNGRVSNAQIRLHSMATGSTYQTESNALGMYKIISLPLADYTITVEHPGFKKLIVGPFKLEMLPAARVDLRLVTGSTSESVENKTFAPVLQAESAESAQTLAATLLTAIPLNGRNAVSLTLLIPGATTPNPIGMNSRLGSRPFVNGNREQTNEFLLDGGDVNDSFENRVAYTPSVDALQEVSVVTGNAPAQFGNAGGATVLLWLKSGTNQMHGSAFEFFRNNRLDANGFFRNRVNSTATRTTFNRNIFGATLGGPLRRNKLYFFIDYEGNRQHTNGPATASVAPPAWRAGDLSAFTNTVFDPLNGLPFPQKRIPQTRFSPVAQHAFSSPSLYPLPNQQGAGSLQVAGNYAGSAASDQNNQQGDLKLDYRLSGKDSFMGRYSRAAFYSASSQAPIPVLMTSGLGSPFDAAVIGWNRAVSATMSNELRVAYSHLKIDESPVDWSGQLGIDGNAEFGIAGPQPIAGLSSIAIGGGLTGIGAAGVVTRTGDSKYSLYDNFSWRRGRHLFRFGGLLMRYHQNRYFSGSNGVLGEFSYTGAYTGLDYADFLLDTLARKGRGAVNGAWGQRFWRPALYVQDDFKASPTLTLNWGLRWEYLQPAYEVNDRQINIDTHTGQLLTPGDGYGRALYKGRKLQLMPRAGFAWSPRRGLVIRGGAAVQSFMESTVTNLRLPLNPPYFVETDFNYDIRVPGSILTGFADVLTANFTLGMPRPASAGLMPQLQGRALDLDLRPQETYQVNLTAEFQLDRATSVAAGYIGQKGRHLIAPVEANQPLPGTGPFSAWGNLNLRRPLIDVLPNVGNIARTESSATMDYHSLQISARRRASSGLHFLAAYSFGKTLTDSAGNYGSPLTAGEGSYWQNAYDREANRGRAFFDIRHNFTIGGTWDLPFGTGAPSPLRGWTTNFNLQAHSGLPLTVRALDRTGQAVRGNVRANYYAPLSVDESNRTVDNWFGLPVDSDGRISPNFCAAGVAAGGCAYGQPADGSFGSAGVGTERGPGFFNLNLSAGKRFSIGDRQNIDIRCEFFNAFNHVSWAPPVLNISMPNTFGAIGSQVQNPRNIQFALKYQF